MTRAVISLGNIKKNAPHSDVWGGREVGFGSTGAYIRVGRDHEAPELIHFLLSKLTLSRNAAAMPIVRRFPRTVATLGPLFLT